MASRPLPRGERNVGRPTAGRRHTFVQAALQGWQGCAPRGLPPRATVNATPYIGPVGSPAGSPPISEDCHMQLWRRDRDRDTSFVSNRVSRQDEEPLEAYS